MNVFDLRQRLVDDYAGYTKSFIKIADTRIKETVDAAMARGEFWPEPLLQLNPTFQSGGTIDDLVKGGALHPECARIFRFSKSDSDPIGKPLVLHEHQRAAILKAKEGKSYVLTSGTGSGKSLTYIVPIVDQVLRRGSGQGVQAIVVYPMNALANSQEEELKKFLCNGYPEGKPPIRFARYTGQEKGPARDEIRSNPPDLLLTNYMMLELLLTRHEDSELVRAIKGLKFLVFDELHTYRGRQGADIALLIRRCRQAFGDANTICVGTSATMASGGSLLAQEGEVAKVASTLFGVPVTPDQVISESLERATGERDFSNAEVLNALRNTIDASAVPPKDYSNFTSHPLSSWIESTFGICREVDGGRWVRQVPRRLRGESSASDELARLTGTGVLEAEESLRAFLQQGAELRRSESSRFPVFAFRLHQFFTRGDTVWATIESEGERHLEIAKKGSKPGEPDKLLFPLVFCRQCGAAYYRVKAESLDGGILLVSREDRREENDDGSGDAYLHLSAASPWPRTEGPDLLARVPESMKETTPQGVERVRPESRKDLPEIVFVDPQGRIVPEGEGVRGALVSRSFRFCLDCGVTYAGTQRSERSKLGTLGVDNRSTATTILAVRSLIELQGDRSLEPEARKLLSFTDNRQDASLQAGHFNDFAQVALLRSALYKAAVGRGEQGLTHGDLSRAVFEAMQLAFEEYAADPSVRGPARNATNDAFRRVIDYFLYRDLQRGWRVTAPNLEDCGLLAFEYEGLKGKDGLLEESELWSTGFEVTPDRNQTQFVRTPLPLQACPTEVREVVLRTLLDVLRRSLAIKIDVLDPQKQLDLVELSKPRLLEDTVWYLRDTAELAKSVVAYPRPKAKNERSTGLFISSFGGYGRYVKRALEKYAPAGHKLGRADIDEIIHFLLRSLKRYGIVEQVRSGDDGSNPGYQINADALRWLPGSGEVRPIDRTRLIEAGETLPEVNQYFVECYRHFVDLKCVLEAREHTAQVDSSDREDREKRFRSGDLPLLFCSPTMELGVDIAQLNLVNLRNVPPTPANYAQRSGRAGRGGQQALVFTYCAGRSPHDQYYFHQPTKMVAGVVAAPRIDIRNRDLIRSHVHAVWMEVAKPDLGKTLKQVLELTPLEGNLPLAVKPEMVRELQSPAHRVAAFQKASVLIQSIAGELDSAAWFHGNWLRETLEQVERSFQDSCERWRSLYRAAIRQQDLHNRIILDTSRPESERDHSRRLRAQAESQIRLLTEAEGIYEGDFYSYRYFAAEGFLPGYNFPRLPLSAYIPGRGRRRGHDEFVSRPRFLAISEFGPRALIYHEGARYRVYKANLDFGSGDVEAAHELPTSTMKRCAACGYAHLEGEVNLNSNCDRCGSAFTTDSHVFIPSLVHLQNVSLKLAQRITCDEEERQRYGYKLVTAYRFPEVGGKQDRKDAEVFCGGLRALEMSYGDAANLYRINLGWANARNQPPGFNLDLERGYWAKNQTDDTDREDAASTARIQRVVPFVRDSKNALVMRFDPPRTGPEMAALQAAFKEAIQKHYQIEPRELSCEPMPSHMDRKEILFYESSEGGAGVLRQIVEDPGALPALARCALEICHFDPDTLEDLGAAKCGKACYECLLDYGNQPDHRELDRNLIRDLLAELSRSECKPAGGAGSRAERLLALRKRCDSGLEKRWLDMVDRLMLRLPSDAQYPIPGYYTKPDFFYGEHNAAIYIDGPPHDQPNTLREDDGITEALISMGYIVIRFHHKADWLEIFRRHPDVFGIPQA